MIAAVPGRGASGLRSRALTGSASGDYAPPTSHGRIRELKQQMAELYRAGRYGDARDIGEECRSLVIECFGAEHPVSASAANDLALMHKSLGDTDEASALYAEALSTYRAVVGEEHTSTATAACNLALLYRDSADDRKLAEAAVLLEGALRTRRLLLGPSHVDVAATMQQLASVVARQPDGISHATGLLEDALDLLDVAGDEVESEPHNLAKRERLLKLATTLNSLGLLRKRQGQLTEARPLYLRAAALREKMLGEVHPESIACQHNLAELALAEGNHAEATRVQQSILARLAEERPQEAAHSVKW
eukprot:CAMPEP_0181228392 /NCGR_PEP_ID=MMETSP1096-20121128/33322_1 /TAXON_ID=156174 ORGANISM="Chrysochromulina ericina, Strain CCMP281" /NCGR_SAMPLE_ID=MMETSP1096 /ASSEMBLY_ACC=CAM_ASM_000453 /LENGTH=305 /DNA_ID=CAMNT_0023321911 /DNA_START=133 /DNA_END=1050 /DNA_ORIENTATION=+